MAVLMARKVPGALLIGIVTATVVGMVINKIADGTPVLGAQLPNDIVAKPDFGLVGDISFNVFEVVASVPHWPDRDRADGQLLRCDGHRSGCRSRGPAHRRRRPAAADASCPAGRVGRRDRRWRGFGLVEHDLRGEHRRCCQGARTGLANIVTGACSCSRCSSPRSPGSSRRPRPVLPWSSSALMISQISGIEWDDMGIAVPAFLTIVLMPFTYSIANGVGADGALRADRARSRPLARHPPAARRRRRGVHLVLRPRPDLIRRPSTTWDRPDSVGPA